MAEVSSAKKSLRNLKGRESSKKGAAALSPTQNALCERKGGAWKVHAKATIDEFSISFKDVGKTLWMCTCINWATNSMVNDSGYSPAQWVLGRGLKLPYDLLSQSSKLSLHSRVVEDKSFAERIAMMSAAQRSAIALKYSKSLSHAITARSRVIKLFLRRHDFGSEIKCSTGEELENRWQHGHLFGMDRQ